MSVIRSRKRNRWFTRQEVPKGAYEEPFITFTWAEWEDMYVKTFASFIHFKQAIERGQLATALELTLERGKMLELWLEEVKAQRKQQQEAET